MLKFSVGESEIFDYDSHKGPNKDWEEAETGLLRETVKECELSRTLHHTGIIAEAKDGFRAALRQSAMRFEYVDFDFSKKVEGFEQEALPIEIQDRYVRCYVIAPFSDMQAERRLLAQEVFPTLRARCVQIGIHFMEVDFGWGVVQNLAERKSGIISRLLEMKQNIRTYVVGLVGERYGYTYYHDADVNHGFLDPLFISKRPTVLGLQEVELDEGPLSSDCIHKCFFYFRDARYFDQVDNADVRRTLACEGLLSRERLSNMKSKIRLSSIQIKDNYQDPEEVASLILSDLSTQIAEDFPNDYTSNTTANIDELIAFEYEECVLKTFYGRDEELDAIDLRILAIQDHPLPTVLCGELWLIDPILEDFLTICLSGESGCGKSALVVAWSRRFEQVHPVDFFFKHYASLNNHSADWVTVVKRALDGLKSSFRLRTALPTDINQLAGAFSSWIHALPYLTMKVIFMLDGIDSVDNISMDEEATLLDNNNVGQQLEWLPKVIPPNFRMLLTCATGTRALDVLNSRKWNILHISSLDEKSRENLIKTWIRARGINLAAGALDRIMKRQQARNTLFLVQVLRGIQCPEDVRPSGSMGLRLFSKSVSEMADAILEGLETNRGMQERGGMQEDFFSFIALSRRGLSEFELLDMMQVPRALFSKFFLEARQLLKVCFGLLSFCHNIFETAVKKKYLQQAVVRKNVRMRLIEYFQSRPICHRTIEELPWQLYQSRQWQELSNAIMNPEVFMLLSSTEVGIFDMVVYWSALLSGESTASDLITKCDHCMSVAKESSFSFQERLNLYFSLSEVLQLLGFYDAALPFERRAYELEDRVNGVSPLIQVKYDIREMKLMMNKSDFQRAQTILEKIVKNLRHLVDTDGDGSISYEELRATEAGTLLLDMEEELLYLLWKSKQFVKLGGFCKAMLIREYDRPTNKFLLLDSLLFAFIQRGHTDSANEFLDDCLRDAVKLQEHDLIYLICRKIGVLLLQERYQAIVTLIQQKFQELIDSTVRIDHTNQNQSRTDLVAMYTLALCCNGQPEDSVTILTKLVELRLSRQKKEEKETDSEVEEDAEADSEVSFAEGEPAEISMGTDGWFSDIMLQDLLGMVRRQLCQFQEAEECHKRALNLKILAYGASDHSISFTLSEIASIYECRRMSANAITIRKAAAQICHDSHGYTSLLHFKALLAVASCYWKFGEYLKAEQLALTVLFGLESRFGAHHETIASAALILGMCHLKLDKIKSAGENLQRAQQLARSTWGPCHSDSLHAHLALADLHELNGDYDLAETALLKLRAERSEGVGSWSFGSAREILALSILYFRIGALHEAEQYLKNSLPGLQMCYGAESLDIAGILTLLCLTLSAAAKSFKKTGGHTTAMALRAFRIRRSVLGIDSPLFLQHCLFTALLLEHLSSQRFAEPLFRKSYCLLGQSDFASTQLKQSIYRHYEACNKAGFSAEEWRPMISSIEQGLDIKADYSDPLFDAMFSMPVSPSLQETSNNLVEALEFAMPNVFQQVNQNESAENFKVQQQDASTERSNEMPAAKSETLDDQIAHLTRRSGIISSDVKSFLRPMSAPSFRPTSIPRMQRPATAAGVNNRFSDRTLSQHLSDEGVVSGTRLSSAVDIRLRLRMDPNSHDEAGNTSLHHAVSLDDFEAIRSLVDSRAAVDISNRVSETPAHIAARRGRVEALQILSQAGADMNTPGPRGYTALHFAVEADSLAAVRLLCEQCGADISAEDDNGLTPLQLAYTVADARRTPILEYLQRANDLLPSI